VAFGLIGMAMFLALLRVVRGPTLPDRVVALDLMATLAMGFIALYAVTTGQAIFLDVAIALALIAFLGTVAFAYFIAPVAAHVLGRAAYFSGVALWLGTLSDELRGQYAQDTHRLAGPPEETPSPADQMRVSDHRARLCPTTSPDLMAISFPILPRKGGGTYVGGHLTAHISTLTIPPVS
jgi:multicomponent Na+:H+ antiporter subunit F